jgi:K+-transporting ATPase ATPase C chain
MFWTACKIFLAMTILTGCIYPFLVTEIATIVMPYQANGSLIFEKGQLRGSELIGQSFTGAQYFWSRPSTGDYNSLRSSGSNLGPTSRKLKDLVKQRAQKLKETHQAPSAIPVDLVYASGSGLDPHISVSAANYQIDRIVRARSLTQEQQNQLHALINELIEGQAGLLGPRHINVLLLNKQLDQKISSPNKS